MFIRPSHSRSLVAATVLAALISVASASAHEEKADAKHAHASADTAFGRPGAAAKASRTVAVKLTDAMRFAPDTLRVTRGETIRLRITNTGALPHEFVLGTKAEIDAHAQMMKKMPNMVHTDASSVRVAPGKTAELVWQFSTAGTFYYACLVAGHREAGMQGTVIVSAPVRR